MKHTIWTTQQHTTTFWTIICFIQYFVGTVWQRDTYECDGHVPIYFWSYSTSRHEENGFVAEAKKRKTTLVQNKQTAGLSL